MIYKQQFLHSDWLGTSNLSQISAISPVQKSEIECQKVKLSVKSETEYKTVKFKMIDSSYSERGETKWRTNIIQRLKIFI